MPSKGAVIELPAKLKALYELFARLDTDVSIEEIYSEMFGAAKKERWEKQQQLGPYITKLNRRIAGNKLKVRPGDAKGTYRLAALTR